MSGSARARCTRLVRAPLLVCEGCFAVGCERASRSEVCVQRAGRMALRAAHGGSNSSSPGWYIENRHGSGQDHHSPKVFRTRGTAAADHSAEAAKPRRRSRIAGSTSYVVEVDTGLAHHELPYGCDRLQAWLGMHCLGVVTALPLIR